MLIGEVLNGVYDGDLGWRPASGSVKPVHVANGLFRAISGGYHDIGALLRLVVFEKRGRPIEGRSVEDLISDGDGLYAAFADDPAELQRLRRYARGILNPECAANPSAAHSSLTLTCELMVSRDTNDRRLGAFAAALLGRATDADSLAAVLQDALRVDVDDGPRDPITTLVWPLLGSPDAGRTVPPDSRDGALVTEPAQRVLSQLRQAASSLAGHERAHGNRLRKLQRATAFAVAATFAHAQGLAADGKMDERPPLLLLADAPKGSPLADTSEQLLAAFYRRFESWLEARLAHRLSEAHGAGISSVPVDADHARALLHEIEFARQNMPADAEEKARQRRDEAFREACLAYPDDAVRAYARALCTCYLAEYSSGGPRQFLERLGFRSGFLYPSRGRTKAKRVMPAVLVLDTLVRACVPVGGMLPLEDFLESLWQRFGLLVGGRRAKCPSDADLLRRAGLPLDDAVLSSNADAVVSRLQLMGLARCFADRVTFVGDADAH